jgi:hypothetical protein
LNSWANASFPRALFHRISCKDLLATTELQLVHKLSEKTCVIWAYFIITSSCFNLETQSCDDIFCSHCTYNRQHREADMTVLQRLLLPLLILNECSWVKVREIGAPPVGRLRNYRTFLKRSHGGEFISKTVLMWQANCFLSLISKDTNVAKHVQCLRHQKGLIPQADSSSNVDRWSNFECFWQSRVIMRTLSIVWIIKS